MAGCKLIILTLRMRIRLGRLQGGICSRGECKGRAVIPWGNAGELFRYEAVARCASGKWYLKAYEGGKVV
jgi:hypothetical protein